MRLADLLVRTLVEEYGIDTVFTVTGGGAMYLNDAFGGYGNSLNYIALHHEQSVAMAGESFAAITQGLGVCQVTTGPGGTNSVTGCAGAWIDSRPVLFISGQVESLSISGPGLRQTGVQEAKIIDLVASITKASVRLDDPLSVLYELDRLIHIAMTGRRGPVWMDIPLDVQSFMFPEITGLRRFTPQKPSPRTNALLDTKMGKLKNLLTSVRKPLLCIGEGARRAGPELLKIAENLGVPVVLGWNAKDLYPEHHPLIQGTIGQFGNRGANLLTAKADLIIGVGFRFSVPQVGYDPSHFAPQATIVSVDIDPYELAKYGTFIDVSICADSVEFAQKLAGSVITDPHPLKAQYSKWTTAACRLKALSLDRGPRDTSGVNSFDFTDRLGELLPKPSIIVTDMGTSFTCTHQHLKIKDGVRLFTSSGLAAMGFGLPGAIGAYYASAGVEAITLITGDGGLMFNLQELQSIVTHSIPLKIIIYENKGYLTMRLMQLGRFNRLVGSGPSSSLECPDFGRLCAAFGIKCHNVGRFAEIDSAIEWLYEDLMTPSVLVVHLDQDQPLIPRVQTQTGSDGVLIPGVLKNMYPPLSPDQESECERLFD